jgi:hypothetical protein
MQLLQQRAEQLPRNLRGQPSQRITHAADALWAAVDVEEPRLRYRSGLFSIWNFAVFGGLRGQVGGVLAGFDAFRANPTENTETPARAASGNARTRKLQFSI